MVPLNLGREFFLLAILLVASYWDLKKREINPDLWYLSAKISLPFTIYGTYLDLKTFARGLIKISILLDLVVILLYLGLFLLGFMGGADVGAVIVTALSVPYLKLRIGHTTFFMPVAFLVAFLGSLLQLLWHAVMVCNLNLRFPEGFRGIKCPLRLRVKIKRLLKLRWWFLYGGKFFEEFSLEEWPHYRIAEVMKSRGPDAVVEAVPGMPHVFFYMLGYVIVFAMSIFR